MYPSALGEQLYRLCTSLRDLVAGDPRERDFLLHVARLLDSPGIWIHLSPVPVLAWRDEGSSVAVDGRVLRALAMPFSPRAHVVASATSSLRDAEGRVYVAEWPRDLDDAKYVVLDAARAGAEAVIFAGGARRIAVPGDPAYTFDAAPTPIPVVSVDAGVDELVGRRVEVRVETRAEETYSYNVVAMNDLEPRIIVSAHYDHWLIGASDNCGGLWAAATVFAELMARDVPVAFAMFTAEEGVAPHVPSLYWAWGSRNYFNRFGVDVPVLNFDVVGVGTHRVYAVPYLSHVLGVEAENPMPYFDTISLEERGGPAVTISSLWDTWGVYHSEGDSAVDPALVADAARLGVSIAHGLLGGGYGPDASRELSELGLVGDPAEAWHLLYNYVIVVGGGTSEFVYGYVPRLLSTVNCVDCEVWVAPFGRICRGVCVGDRLLGVYRDLLWLRLRRG